MRLAPAVLAALITTGCGARSGLPEDGPRGGGGILLTQGALSRWVTPATGTGSVVSFYDYTSASGHTGFEALEASELYFYRDPTGVVSLVTEHGIDQDSSGLSQPVGQVNEELTGLPPGVTVTVADDNKSEFSMDSSTSARGQWNFQDNTDGGALSGFPVPGSWSVQITADFVTGIDAWRFFGPDAIQLQMGLPVTLTAYDD